MPIERFSFIEFEKRIAEIELDIDRIDYISREIVRCKNAIQNVKCEAKKIEPGEIKFFVKIANQDKSIFELINTDQNTKRTAMKKIAKICKKNLCEEYYDFLERAEALLTHYKTKLEMRAAWNEYNQDENTSGTPNDSTDRIVWRLDEKSLLAMLNGFIKNGSIANYSREELLVHFANERMIPFAKGENYKGKIIWLKSDSSFSVFVDELTNIKAIDEANKYKLFGGHFCNRRGKPFKNLAQKKNNTITYTKTVKWIRKILESVGLTVSIFVMREYFLIYDITGDYLKSISEYIAM